MSLEAAVVDQVGKPQNDPVRFYWGCERDAHCQEVLGLTYGCCVFTDVMEMTCPKKRLYCATHDRDCKCSVPKKGGRN